MSTDTSTTRPPLGLRTSDLVTAAATGLLTLPDPARRTPATRFALRTAVAGTTGAGVWLGTDGGRALDLPSRVAFTAGAVGFVYGAAELGEAVDRALQRRLVRMGVRRPRVTMALAGVGASLAISLLERRAEAAEEEDDAPEGPVLRPLPEPVRELVSAILSHTEDYDSLRLRAQLTGAREEVWGEPEDAPPDGRAVRARGRPARRAALLHLPGERALHLGARGALCRAGPRQRRPARCRRRRPRRRRVGGARRGLGPGRR
ncbi:hypothetical protein [Georgenia sp. Marseille-Q6866]